MTLVFKQHATVRLFSLVVCICVHRPEVKEKYYDTLFSQRNIYSNGDRKAALQFANVKSRFQKHAKSFCTNALDIVKSSE